MKKRFTEKEIIGFLKQAEAGVAAKELCWQHGFCDASFYKLAGEAWRHGGFRCQEATFPRLRLRSPITSNLRSRPYWPDSNQRASTKPGWFTNRVVQGLQRSKTSQLAELSNTRGICSRLSHGGASGAGTKAGIFNQFY